MSVIEHQHGERPSADSPGCEEYFVVQCDHCGECWEVEPDAEELTVNIHVCAECAKAEELMRMFAVTQCLVREIDAVLASKGIRTRLCDTNIAWHARRVREALTANSATRIQEVEEQK